MKGSSMNQTLIRDEGHLFWQKKMTIFARRNTFFKEHEDKSNTSHPELFKLHPKFGALARSVRIGFGPGQKNPKLLYL